MKTASSATRNRAMPGGWRCCRVHTGQTLALCSVRNSTTTACGNVNIDNFIGDVGAYAELNKKMAIATMLRAVRKTVGYRAIYGDATTPPPDNIGIFANRHI